jgi:SGNH domain (fused to AT3 domains)
MAMERPHDCINLAHSGPLLTPKCFPAATSRDSVAVLGDSHADTLRPVVSRSGRQLLVLASFSCPPVSGYTRSIADLPQFADDCARFNTRALDLILRRPDVKVVYLAGSWPRSPTFKFLPSNSTQNRDSISPDDNPRNIEQGLKNEVATLEGAGKQVVLIDDWPSLPFAPLDRLKYSYLPARRLLADALSCAPIGNPAASSIPRNEIVSRQSEQLYSHLMTFAASDPPSTCSTPRASCVPRRCASSRLPKAYSTPTPTTSAISAPNAFLPTSIEQLHDGPAKPSNSCVPSLHRMDSIAPAP